MILSRRVHRPCSRVGIFSCLLAAAAMAGAHAEPVVEVITENTSGPTILETIKPSPPSVPFHFKFGLDTGYDDNINQSPSPERAWFTRGQITFSYDRVNTRTQLHLITSGGITHFFKSSASQDENANITLSLVHNISSRLSFSMDVYASYQVEPDFNVNVGPENVRANHFQTTDNFSLSYHWLPRFATITNYAFRLIKYDDPSIGMFQDRIENTLGEVFQLNRSPRTNLFAEYRFKVIEYDSVPNGSTTQYALVGIDHKLTEHLTFNLRGGGTFRTFEEGGERTDPYFEGALDYTKSDRSSMRWVTSYGVEEPNSTTTGSTSVNVTLRTGLQLGYSLSARITATAGVYYNHATTESVNSTLSVPETSQDSLDFSLGLRYAINQRFVFHIDYNRTSVMSEGSTQSSTSDYSRNRYFAGVSFAY